MPIRKKKCEKGFTYNLGNDYLPSENGTGCKSVFKSQSKAQEKFVIHSELQHAKNYKLANFTQNKHKFHQT